MRGERNQLREGGMAQSTEPIEHILDAIYREDSRRILATLIRLLGDFELAEDALQDAFKAALVQWPKEGVPANPRAWLISTGRHKAIDLLRRQARLDASRAALTERTVAGTSGPEVDEEEVRDDRLRLIFTCCHPALGPEARLALTLREVCGLTTEEVARACLTSPPTLAQRIVRAKAKIRDARIPYQVPSAADLPERLETVLQVVYLVFNEGYSASSGESLSRPELSGEAIRLGRLLVELLPEPDVVGLLALMLLQESRRLARTSPSGELVLLDKQDRGLWNRELIAEGLPLVRQAMASGRVGALYRSGSHRGRACHRGRRHRDRLGPNRRPLRRAAPNRAFPRDRAQSSRGRGDARRPRRRVDFDRRHPRRAVSWPATTWRMRPVPTCAAAWAETAQARASYERGARPDEVGAGTPVSGAAATGTRLSFPVDCRHRVNRICRARHRDSPRNA